MYSAVAAKEILDKHSNEGFILDHQHSYFFGRLHGALAPGSFVVSVDEMIDAVEPDKPDHDKIDGNDVVQQSRHNQDQDARD